MYDLVLVLTENTFWSQDVGGQTVLYWSLEGLKNIILDCWIHVVYCSKTEEDDDKINQTFNSLSWANIGDIYKAKNHVNTTHGAMMVFPTFAESSNGCYVFDARMILSPGILKGTPRKDWFPYLAFDLGKNKSFPPPLNPGDRYVTPLGLYGFQNYQHFFSAAFQEMPDPVMVYNRMKQKEPTRIIEVQPNYIQWVNDDKSLQVFKDRIVKIINENPKPEPGT